MAAPEKSAAPGNPTRPAAGGATKGSDDPLTVGKIIELSTAHLKKHGSDTPRLDAEILLAHVRGCPRIKLYVDFAEPLPEAQRTTMRDLVKRRSQREPVAYLVGHREFFSLDFKVNHDVLIPRPETETLVLDLITTAKALSKPAILELGTGSGCISIAAAFNLRSAHVTTVDVSEQALAVAIENARRHKVSERVEFLHGDLFAPLAAGTRFDIIASNPPYVADDEMEGLPDDVRLHEPHLALKAGRRGLDVLTRIIADAPNFLNPGGVLLLEISPEQSADVTALLENRDAFTGIRILKDPAGRLRVVRAVLQSSSHRSA